MKPIIRCLFFLLALPTLIFAKITVEIGKADIPSSIESNGDLTEKRAESLLKALSPHQSSK